MSLSRNQNFVEINAILTKKKEKMSHFGGSKMYLIKKEIELISKI